MVRNLSSDMKITQEKMANWEALANQTKRELGDTLRQLQTEINGYRSNLEAANYRERKLREEIGNLEAQKRAFEDLLLRALSRVR